ncbi:DUF2147 domain-containing protein [Aquicoccus sp.]|uniref:DUF2147 domain-containing protein n=1 Tax=Aquicoccus sp. TaxID=2055851 RepID=UPI003569CCF0
MKRLVMAAMVTAIWSGSAVADPAEGMWNTEVDDGAYAHVAMQPCGENICGIIARTFNSDGEYNSPNKGKLLVRDMQANGDGSYAGRVWRPSNDKVYTGTMQVNGDSLTLKGCVAGGLICSSQEWTRIE